MPPEFEEGVRVVSRKLLLLAHYAILLAWSFMSALAVLVLPDASLLASLVMFTVVGATLVISAQLTFPLVLRAVRIRISFALGVYLPLFVLATLGNYYSLVLAIIARVTFELVTRSRSS